MDDTTEEEPCRICGELTFYFKALPAPVCRRCIAGIAVFESILDAAPAAKPYQDRESTAPAPFVPPVRRLRPDRPGAVVYYLRYDGMIKIGTSVNLDSRLSQYHPGTRLLATEPGSYRLEQQRLDQFRKYLARGREWFIPSDAIEAHIRVLQSSALINSPKPVVPFTH